MIVRSCVSERRWWVGVFVLAAAACGGNSAREIPGPEDGGGGTAEASPRLDGAAPDKTVSTAVDGTMAAAGSRAPELDTAAADSKASVDLAASGATGDAAATTRDGDVAATGASPCPAAGTPCRIMPFGDSITDGRGSTGGGYRVPLFRKAVTAKQSVTFVGSAANGPATVSGALFPRNHEGHSGFTIDPGGGRPGISPLAVKALTTYKPHIVTLMIGTNDVAISLDLASAPKRLGALMDTILDTAPDALLVVAQIVPAMNDKENVRIRAYNAAIPALVKARAAAGKHIIMVDMYGAFTADAAYKTAYLADNHHPQDAGYAKMADVWYAAIGGLLK